MRVKGWIKESLGSTGQCSHLCKLSWNTYIERGVDGDKKCLVGSCKLRILRRICKPGRYHYETTGPSWKTSSQVARR